jgi:formylglycine-generating enzyme required for sulfatase activity
MVLLPGGTYTTKSYRKAATLVPFWLDVTEVTAGAYRACVVAGKCNEEGLLCDEIHTYGVRGKESHPINCVSQRQAMDHCAYLGKRLPTPEEWEWAARGTTRGSTYPWGEQEPSRQLCWKRYDYQEHLVSRRFCPEDTPKECFNTSVWEGRKRVDGPCRVRSFPAGSTPQGIADLAGNVSEWTAGGSPKGRPLRGCDWKENDPRGAEASADGQARLDAHLDSVGFRCAWTAMAAP